MFQLSVQLICLYRYRFNALSVSIGVKDHQLRLHFCAWHWSWTSGKNKQASKKYKMVVMIQKCSIDWFAVYISKTIRIWDVTKLANLMHICHEVSYKNKYININKGIVIVFLHHFWLFLILLNVVLVRCNLWLTFCFRKDHFICVRKQL
jgi:hypothetical protein